MTAIATVTKAVVVVRKTVPPFSSGLTLGKKIGIVVAIVVVFRRQDVDGKRRRASQGSRFVGSFSRATFSFGRIRIIVAVHQGLDVDIGRAAGIAAVLVMTSATIFVVASTR